MQQGHQVLIILDEGANKTAIRDNFQKFQQLFSINMGKNTTVHFENGKGELFFDFFFMETLNN